MVQATSRKKIPFGIAQIGKSFRNEITPGNFVFRMREFEQMELEFFVEPGTDEDWHQSWIDMRMQWYLDLGLKAEHLRVREHEPDELSHYAKRRSTSSSLSRGRTGPSSRASRTAPTTT